MPLGLWIWYFGSLAPLQWSLLVYFLSSLHWKIKGCMWVRTIYESVSVSFRQPQKFWRMFSLKTWKCCPHKKLLHPGVVGEYQWDRPLQSDHVLPATPCPCSYQLPMLSLLCHTQPSVTQCAGQLYSRALSGVWGACEWYLIGHTPAHSDLPAKQSRSCPTRLYFWRSEHIYEGSDWCWNLKMGHLSAVHGKTSIHSFVDKQWWRHSTKIFLFDLC